MPLSSSKTNEQGRQPHLRSSVLPVKSCGTCLLPRAHRRTVASDLDGTQPGITAVYPAIPLRNSRSGPRGPRIIGPAMTKAETGANDPCCHAADDDTEPGPGRYSAARMRNGVTQPLAHLKDHKTSRVSEQSRKPGNHPIGTTGKSACSSASLQGNNNMRVGE